MYPGIVLAGAVLHSVFRHATASPIGTEGPRVHIKATRTVDEAPAVALPVYARDDHDDDLELPHMPHMSDVPDVPDKWGKMNTTQILVIVLSILAVIIFLAITITCCCWRRKIRRRLLEEKKKREIADLGVRQVYGITNTAAYNPFSVNQANSGDPVPGPSRQPTGRPPTFQNRSPPKTPDVLPQHPWPNAVAPPAFVPPTTVRNKVGFKDLQRRIKEGQESGATAEHQRQAMEHAKECRAIVEGRRR
ncbi:hypothetical protein B0T26DRAFT_669384 [Lasiosphaeria miniovina]|uniref:Uncharacterized protein n=1 Tax=Lasiosphaeria miniovina TaxID=1954250 RepID=A0AA40E946_9PEZI|nr:uncharacterized protein B0T26DRAFT_669384 [Lasiosphaeria miniovina]KAK0732919.1 hypothetical protein B0T26DRAFT_669384 [Lasiosphaeria miniovina]